MIRVLVSGIDGKMGTETAAAIDACIELELLGGVEYDDDLTAVIKAQSPDVVVDFTRASVGFENAQTIIASGACPVIGTSGFTDEQVQGLSEQCAQKSLGGVIAPNFSIGAVLMMQFAAKAAQYFSSVEIIEGHHPGKEEAPSGTALKTAEMIAQACASRLPVMQSPNSESTGSDIPAGVTAYPSKELMAGARGGTHKGVHLHALRLPGLLAEQQVIFGEQGETLRLQHQTLDRSCFMPGVLLACQRVVTLKRLVYGLEHLL